LEDQAVDFEASTKGGFLGIGGVRVSEAREGDTRRGLERAQVGGVTQACEGYRINLTGGGENARIRRAPL
jgi:hypothetical protein